MNVRNTFQFAVFLFSAFFIVSGCECKNRPSVGNANGELVFYFPAPTPEDPTARASGRDAVYDFGTVFMGQTKQDKIVIQNFGSGALILDKIEYVSGNKSKIGDETVGEAPAAPVFDVRFTPGSELVALQTLEIDMSFTPESLENVKQVEHEVVLYVRTSNEKNTEPAKITLKGLGVSGVCEVPMTIDFGSVAVGDTGKASFKLRNPTQIPATATVGDITSNSPDRLAYAFAAEAPRGTITLDARAERDVTLEFSPTEMRPYLAFLDDVSASDGCPKFRVQLVGKGVDNVLTWEPSPLDFLYVTPPASVTKALTFKNAGNTEVTLTNVKTALSDYKPMAEMNGGTLPAQLKVPARGEKVVYVSFKPGGLGPRNSTMSFSSSLPRQPSGQVTLKGFGGGPDIEVKPSPTLNFGKIAYFAGANSFQTRKLTVMNVGSKPVTADVSANLRLGKNGAAPFFDLKMVGSTQAGEIEVTVPPAYDPAVGLEATVGKNLVDLIVKVTPKSLGQKQAELVIYSNDADEAETKILITADAAVFPPCNYSVTPIVLNYGVVTPPSYKDLSFTITNLGQSAQDECLLSGLDIGANSAPEFTLPNGPIASQTLAPGASVNVLVRAWPQKLDPAQATKRGTVDFFMSSPIKPQATVSLEANVAASCLTILPDSINFGTVQQGCNSASKTITVYNTCGSDVTINSISMQSAAGQPAGGPNCSGAMACPEFSQTNSGIPAGGLVIPKPGTNGVANTYTFSARYKPIDFGTDTGAVAINVKLNGQNQTYVVTLSGKGDSVGENTDIFRQDSKPKADILLVIDNSGSMSEEQMSLAMNFASFIRYAESRGIDYNIAVTTTDMDDQVNAAGRFQFGPSHPEKVISSTTVDRATKFAAKVNVGINGSATEMDFAPALAALTAPLVVNENANFLRDDANLAVVAITDEDEQSPQAQAFYFNALMNIKGFQRANMFSFNAIYTLPPCPTPITGTDVRMGDMVTQTNGVKESICTPDWAKALEQLGKTAFGYRTNFFLNATPDLTAGKTITVKVNGVTLPQTDSRGAKVWSYDPVANSVNFEPLFVPEPGQTLSITYRVICVP